MALGNPHSDLAPDLSAARLLIRFGKRLKTLFVFAIGRPLIGVTLAKKFCMQNFEAMALLLGCIGTLCWITCFWWMHRISSRQDAMLEELHEMTTRIEKLSRAEHDLISDVHPQVSEIKQQVENVREVVSSEKS